MELNKNDIFDSLNFSLHESACRTCLILLKESRNQKRIFQQNIKIKIENLISEKLYEEEGVPNFICDTCFEKLNSAVEFKEQVETINDVLKQYLGNLSITESVSKTGSATPVLKDVREKSCELSIGKIKKYDESYNSPPNEEADTKEVKEETSQNVNNCSSRRITTFKKQKTSVVCPTCNKKLKHATSLKAHLKIHGVIEKKLECDNCGKKYTNQYDLRVHLRKHSGARPFSCNVCQKAFADQRCYEKHKKIHSGEKLFKCELCDKSFIHSYTLKTHQRVHSGEKPFICAKCGHSFGTSTQLKIHTRIHHTREKPYACNLCSKVFVCSSGLSNHKMTHTGERKFICSVCGKGSRTTSDLKCHLRTHTGERPFKCTFPDCEKKYKTNSQLCTHIRTHTGEKSKKCELSTSFPVLHH